MIHRETLTNMAEGFNRVPCALCGGNHRVNLSLNSIHAFSKSSGDWLVFPTGDKVFIEFSEDSCDGFKSRVVQFVLSCSCGFIDVPFDKI